MSVSATETYQLFWNLESGVIFTFDDKSFLPLKLVGCSTIKFGSEINTQSNLV